MSTTAASGASPQLPQRLHPYCGKAHFPLAQRATGTRVTAVDIRTWYRWERGESVPRHRNLRKIAEAFGVPYEELETLVNGLAHQDAVQRLEQRVDEQLAHHDALVREMFQALSAQIADDRQIPNGSPRRSPS